MVARIAAALFVALLLTACKVPVERNVLLYGDSLLARSLHAVTHELLMADDAGYMIIANAISGTAFSAPNAGSLYYVQRAPSLLAQLRIDDLVISLGANDVFMSAALSEDELTAAALRLIDAYPDIPVLWVLPHANLGSIYPQAAYAKVLAAIGRAAASRPNVRLADFTAYAAARGHTMDSLTIADRLHFTEAGEVLFAEFIHQQLMP